MMNAQCSLNLVNDNVWNSKNVIHFNVRLT